MGKTSWAGDVMTRRLKSTWGATLALAFCHSAKHCVCVRHDLCSVSLIYCCLLSYNSSNIESSRMSKLRQRQRNVREKADHVTDCVFLSAPHYIKWDTQFVRGLIVSEACRVGSRGGRLPALWVASTTYASLPESSLWGGSFHQGSSRWLCSWESQVDQMEGMKTGEPLSSSFPSSPPRDSSPRRKGSTLRLSSSEEVDVEVADELSQSLMFAQAYCEWALSPLEKKGNLYIWFRMLQHDWSSANPKVPMSHLSLSPCAGYRLQLALSSRHWCLPTEQPQAQHLLPLTDDNLHPLKKPEICERASPCGAITERHKKTHLLSFLNLFLFS